MINLSYVALSLGSVALWQRKSATGQRNQAQSVMLATQAKSLANYQPDVAMLLAAAAYQIAHTREAIDALTSIESYLRHVNRLLTTNMTDVSQIAFSPTGPTMIVLMNSDGIELWDAKKNIRRGRRDAVKAGTLVFSPDGHILAYTQNDNEGKIVLWSHAENQTLEMPLNLTPGNLLDS